MVQAPRTFPRDVEFADLEEFLEKLWLFLLAFYLTQPLAAGVDKLLKDLDDCRATRVKLARVLAALKAKEIFHDDVLNVLLDRVKELLSADKSDAGVELYGDVFEGKKPAETRKYVLGPQLTTMTLWPGKLAGSTRPEVQAIGLEIAQATKDATILLNDIGTAQTALDQFDLVNRAALVDACNALVKVIYGQLADIELNPPPTAKGPIPPGFVDRFFLRETAGRAPTIKELEKTVERAKEKLEKAEAQLKEAKDAKAQELQEAQDKELKEKVKQMAAAQKVLEDAAQQVAMLQSSIDKLQPPTE